jgi:thiol-disulfide isomerase/thioredoxin
MAFMLFSFFIRIWIWLSHKIIVLFVFLLLGVLLSISCFSLNLYAQKIPAVEYAVIEGKITHPTNNEIAVLIVTNSLDGSKELSSTPIDMTTGSFKLALKLGAPTLMNLLYNDNKWQQPIYVKPGSRITLQFDALNPDKTLKFAGDLANDNNFLAAYQTKFDCNFDATCRDIMDYVVKTPAQILTAENDLKIRKKTFLTEFTQKQPLSEELNTAALNEINYYYAWSLLDYGNNYNIATAQQGSSLPANWLDFIDKEVNIANPNLLKSNVYIAFIDVWLLNAFNQYAKTYPPGVQPEKTALKFKTDLLKQKLATFPELLEYHLARQIILATYLVRSHGAGDLPDIFNDYLRTAQHEPYLKATIVAVETVMQFAPGSSAPNFTAINNQNKPVELANLRGKVVYIDFWASWCKPCLAQIEALKPVKQELLANLNDEVVFLYISLDDDAQSWQNATEKYQIQGIHVRPPDGFKDPIARAYRITGVPVQFVVNKMGNFAPRPPSASQTQALVAYFNQLTKKTSY